MNPGALEKKIGQKAWSEWKSLLKKKLDQVKNILPYAHKHVTHELYDEAVKNTAIRAIVEREAVDKFVDDFNSLQEQVEQMDGLIQY
ncbi:hypothetical protein KAR91_80720 [Candidatus Pacearchaeota archaeon]|nr:hypothetical protein [Candidatus Pacearchaeota archaeon]